MLSKILFVGNCSFNLKNYTADRNRRLSAGEANGMLASLEIKVVRIIIKSLRIFESSGKPFLNLKLFGSDIVTAIILFKGIITFFEITSPLSV